MLSYFGVFLLIVVLSYFAVFLLIVLSYFGVFLPVVLSYFQRFLLIVLSYFGVFLLIVVLSYFAVFLLVVLSYFGVLHTSYCGTFLSLGVPSHRCIWTLARPVCDACPSLTNWTAQRWRSRSGGC